MTVKVLVTGGAGYIGSHACKALARAGFEPVVFDNLSTGWKGAVKWGPLVQGDLMDREAIDAALAEHRPDHPTVCAYTLLAKIKKPVGPVCNHEEGALAT